MLQFERTIWISRWPININNLLLMEWILSYNDTYVNSLDIFAESHVVLSSLLQL